MKPLRLLGVLLCYNDGDILAESLNYLLNQNHHVIVWNHGSTDGTADVIKRFSRELIETRHIPRTFDFYDLYQAMSQNLMDNYMKRYDWVSWPDQDEFLEGPSRVKNYSGWLKEVFQSPYNWIRFNNFNYWWTSADDPQETSVQARIQHYCLFPGCAPRIRSWRLAVTNIRRFNHNPLEGDAWPSYFNLRHYPMRSREQMLRRIERDRQGLRRGQLNCHYDNMRANLVKLEIKPEQLHFDDGRSELDHSVVFDWHTIYGPPIKNQVNE